MGQHTRVWCSAWDMHTALPVFVAFVRSQHDRSRTEIQIHIQTRSTKQDQEIQYPSSRYLPHLEQEIQYIQRLVADGPHLLSVKELTICRALGSIPGRVVQQVLGCFFSDVHSELENCRRNST
jgi:hypothetical protein